MILIINKNVYFYNVLKMGSLHYSGILLEFINGQQIQLSEFDTRNFNEIRTVISTFVEIKKDLKLKIWTKFNKILLAYGLLTILLLITGKLLDII